MNADVTENTVDEFEAYNAQIPGGDLPWRNVHCRMQPIKLGRPGTHLRNSMTPRRLTQVEQHVA